MPLSYRRLAYVDFRQQINEWFDLPHTLRANQLQKQSGHIR